MTKTESKGVTLMAFGNRNYLFMAAHMAMSIKKHSPGVKVTLVHDWNIKYLNEKWFSWFDHIIEIEEKHLYRNGRIDPGWAKVNLYYYLKYEKNIYLDVDGICLKDIEPLFEQEKYFATQVIDQGGKSDKIEYSWWAENDEVWKFFDLDDNAVFYSINSSFMYIERGKKARSLFSQFRKNFNFPMDKLKNKWGKTMPDELIITGTCAKIGHDPSIDCPVVFFGHKVDPRSLSELAETYFVNSLYGNGNGNTLVKNIYVKWYDRMMVNICSEFGTKPILQAYYLMKTKYVG